MLSQIIALSLPSMSEISITKLTCGVTSVSIEGCGKRCRDREEVYMGRRGSKKAKSQTEEDDTLCIVQLKGFLHVVMMPSRLKMWKLTQ